MKSDIAVTMLTSQAFEISRLEKEWLALEQQTQCSFFLTWAWIGGWLKQCIANQQPFYIVQAYNKNHLVGLAIIIKQQRKVFGFFPIKQWWLNRSGIETIDQCWIEENNFLMIKENQIQIQAAFFEFFKNNNSWQELIVGMCDSQTITNFSSLSSHLNVLYDDKGYAIDYKNINSSEHYSQSVLSRNTRQKIKQSEKLLVQQGELTLHVLVKPEDKVKHLKYISRLHIARWQTTETPSGFINASFSHIFDELIIQPNVEIVYLEQNSIALGYLIFFIHQDKVYFYLSALTSNSNNKIKLGMLLHHKAISHYLQLGFKAYDFLAGDARYKKSLTNNEYTQQMIAVYRLSPILFCEKLLKQCKQKYKYLYVK